MKYFIQFVGCLALSIVTTLLVVPLVQVIAEFYSIPNEEGDLTIFVWLILFVVFMGVYMALSGLFTDEPSEIEFKKPHSGFVSGSDYCDGCGKQEIAVALFGKCGALCKDCVTAISEVSKKELCK